jgi:predicted dinucleotide-binding enzyme
MQGMTERETPSVDGLVIGVLGGTGEQGRGLARRFALAGHPVIIGSRSHDRAYAVAREAGTAPGAWPTGMPPARRAW